MNTNRLQVDRTACIGTGLCEFYAPNTFSLDDDGLSEVVEFGTDPQDAIDRAIADCPVHAIGRLTGEAK